MIKNDFNSCDESIKKLNDLREYLNSKEKTLEVNEVAALPDFSDKAQILREVEYI